MPSPVDYTGAELRLGRQSPKKQDWIRGDPNWVAFVARVPFTQVQTVAFVPSVSQGAVLTPPPFIWGVSGWAPEVSGGASIEVDFAAAELVSFIPSVGEGLLVNVPQTSMSLFYASRVHTVSAGAHVSVPIATSVLEALTPELHAGAQLQIPLANIVPTGPVPQIRQDFPYRVLLSGVSLQAVLSNAPTVSTGARLSIPNAALALLAQLPTITAVASVLPTYVGSRNGGGTSSTNWEVEYPAGVAAGDMVIAVVTFNNDTSSVSANNGWSTLYSDLTTWIGWKLHTTGTSMQLTLGAGRGAAWASFAFRGVHQSTTPAIASVLSGDPPALSPPWGAAPTMWVAIATDNASTAAASSITNYTTIVVRASSASARLGTYYRGLAASSENPPSAGSMRAAFTLGIRPA